MKWLFGTAALLLVCSCTDMMDVPTPEEGLEGLYRVQATPRETTCDDMNIAVKKSYLISLNIHDNCCEICGQEGTWNGSTMSGEIKGDSTSLTIRYNSRLSEDEQRPVFRGTFTESRPSAGCTTSWTVVARKVTDDERSQ